ncbi:MAG TPA: hypothetical protein VGR45_18955 [Stellaceae bacterium]|nr:hypothetical protein [Stellaceae bacterium]
MAEDVLASRLEILRGIVRRGFGDTPEQIQGFLVRVLMSGDSAKPILIVPEPSIEECLQATRFGGYPALARLGYCLARCRSGPPGEETVRIFLHVIDRQRERSAQSQAELAGDAIALLGIADGLRAIQLAALPSSSAEGYCLWVRGLIDQHGTSDPRLNRARLLAADLLDAQGRLGRQLAQTDDLRVAALDLCLLHAWPDALRTIAHPDAESRRQLFQHLLSEPAPLAGEPLHAAAWLCALDVLTADLAAASVPDAHQVARILAATQGSFRRWRWELKATRKGVMPARWLIDKEADIQALLLAVLYPLFSDQLDDEQFLQGFGLRQGRFDFAITSLRLIVEVKVIRVSGDVDSLEAQIADDLSLYFKPSNPFESMIVYVYDDRDVPEPEKYPTIRDAIKRRSGRIVDVVIIQRPSMIPDRGSRAA